ncbi:hypothetical protein AVEN_176968-1, partial [Araneus ventricosus]
SMEFADSSILNRGHMTRTTTETAPSSANFQDTPAGGCLTCNGRFNVLHVHIHGGYLVESSFESERLPAPKPRNFSTKL